MTNLHIKPSFSLSGNIQVPGDKSKSHRSVSYTHLTLPTNREV